MAPALISTCIYSAVRSWFWGNKQFVYFSITETAEEVLKILFTVLFISGIFSDISGARGLALAFTVADFTVALLLVLFFFIKGGKLMKPAPLPTMLRPAAPLTAMRVFGSLVGTLLAVLLPARLMAGGLTAQQATADFGRLAGMANPLLFAPNAIIGSLAVVLVPEMSASGVKKDGKALNRHINSGINFGITVSGFFLVIFSALGKEITQILFHDDGSGAYLQAAAWLLLLMPVHLITASALNSVGMEKEAFFSYVGGTVFMLISIYFLTTVIGITSVVIGNAVTLLLCTAGNIYFLRKKTGYSIDFLRTLFLIILFAFPCILLTHNVNSILKNVSPLLAVFAALAAAGALYAVLTSLFGLIPDIHGFLAIKRKKKKQPS
jgi:stage V sporulation protein B